MFALSTLRRQIDYGTQMKARVEFNMQGDNALTTRMRARVEGFPAAVKRAEEASAKEFVKRAKALSQGWVSEDALRKLGHPYRVGGSPPIDPAIINRHTGYLQGSWQWRVTNQGQDVQMTVFNTARYARFMLGTKTMQPRPILQAVFRLEQGARLQRLAAARESILTKKP